MQSIYIESCGPFDEMQNQVHYKFGIANESRSYTYDLDTDQVNEL